MDEFHLLGGHGGKGWKKLNRMARNLEAEIIMASATPNYNDAERVFSITAIGRREHNRDFLTWLYQECITRPNRFAITPYVDGFLRFDGALDYLVNEPYTMYIPDEAVWTVDELVLERVDDEWFEKYNYSGRHHRLMASDMEKRHKRVELELIDVEGFLRKSHIERIQHLLWEKFPDRKKWLIFCNHKTVAEAAAQSLRWKQNIWLITGDSSEGSAHSAKEQFIRAEAGLLIGTTALATGVDGIDKVCQSMLILDDIVGDHALRRQLIGRILPRGGDDGIERIVVHATFK